ncbi:hypothetical protein [Halorubrum yunnanense]|uniref:SHOCT domain-containing protein n=1 Tax=Halorubrum yunnanense TaxID=1526162 RepID=A0ABD5YBU0_9EURY|nr:hypothetical protein [Halorubrum yunnanense]
MDGKRALYYSAVAVAILIGVSVVLSVISTIIGLVTAVVSLAVLAGIAYVAYAVGSGFFGSDDASVDMGSTGASRSTSSASPGGASESRQDRIRRQYVEGQIGEEEFERRIADELETEELDDIDRQLERER